MHFGHVVIQSDLKGYVNWCVGGCTGQLHTMCIHVPIATL